MRQYGSSSCNQLLKMQRPHHAASDALFALIFFTAHYDIRLREVRLEGILNVVADSVSRNNQQVFRETVPQASPLPASIPPPLWQLLVVQMLDWLSPTWRSLLRNCWRTAQHPAHKKLMHQLRGNFTSFAPSSTINLAYQQRNNC